MSDFVTLSCPTCGGKLQITKDIDRFACAHCGNEHAVKRGGGIVALEPVVAGLAKVQVGVDKAASELTIIRLNAELTTLVHQENDLAAKLSRARKEAERDQILSVAIFLTILFGIFGFFISSGASRPVLIFLGVLCGVIASFRIVRLRTAITQIRAELSTTGYEIASKKKELQKHRQTPSLQ